MVVVCSHVPSLSPPHHQPPRLLTPPLPSPPTPLARRQILEQGSSSHVRPFLESLERDLGPTLSGYPLYEPLFQVGRCGELWGGVGWMERTRGRDGRVVHASV